ncbi:hypothetical protein [Marinicella sp. W31]|uniref:hypothetical protein n=1 Tax=Marinicella sp. W31 TaxID=3023713 RepID=UPI003758203C
MKKLIMSVPFALLLIVSKADATNVDVVASCGCEHFGTQYDQVCEASPFDAPQGAAYLYRYIWSATDSSVIISPQVSTSPITTAACFNGSGCEVKLSVTVQAVDSFYFPFQIFVYDEDTTLCASGTPGFGGPM